MVIIIEGPDGAGKSTLAIALREYLRHNGLPVTIVHRAPPTSHVLVEYEDTLPTGNVICDRWHVGELVYGPILRGECKLDPAMLWHVEMFLESRGAVMIYLDAPDEVLYERIYGGEGRGDDLIDRLQLSTVAASYRKLMRHSRLYTLCNPENLAAVCWAARIRGQRAERLRAFPTYVGPRFPDVLLLGERNNFRRQDGPIGPAFVPYADTSGHFLLEALISVDAEERLGSVGIANALQDDAPTLVQTLREPIVVTLGRQAQRAVPSAHGHVSHPQYVRRFHQSAQREYGEAIVLAATLGGDQSAHYLRHANGVS